jgi:hypothetical protein
MNPVDAHSQTSMTVRVEPTLILTVAVVAALMLFARTPASAPAEPWETTLYPSHPPLSDIVPSRVEDFNPTLVTGNGGQ